jgi:deazaflavin-dependent oxidoreductase (nitroreductase family)
VASSSVGRKTGKETIHPVMYLASESDPATIYVFASKAGMETHPDWYWNLTAAGRVTVEVGTETYDATVADIQGEERDRIYAIQAERYPGFAEYEVKTEGIRTIPVLALTRV